MREHLHRCRDATRVRMVRRRQRRKFIHGEERRALVDEVPSRDDQRFRVEKGGTGMDQTQGRTVGTIHRKRKADVKELPKNIFGFAKGRKCMCKRWDIDLVRAHEVPGTQTRPPTQLPTGPKLTERTPFPQGDLGETPICMR